MILSFLKFPTNKILTLEESLLSSSTLKLWAEKTSAATTTSTRNPLVVYISLTRIQQIKTLLHFDFSSCLLATTISCYWLLPSNSPFYRDLKGLALPPAWMGKTRRWYPIRSDTYTCMTSILSTGISANDATYPNHIPQEASGTEGQKTTTMCHPCWWWVFSSETFTIRSLPHWVFST